MVDAELLLAQALEQNRTLQTLHLAENLITAAVPGQRRENENNHAAIDACSPTTLLKGAAAITAALGCNPTLHMLRTDCSRVWEWRGREREASLARVTQAKFYWS